MSENILEVRDLCKDFKHFKLNDVAFSLREGYIMGFIGPNGAGKTTTIKAILNMIKYEKGEITVLGLDNIKDEGRLKDQIGIVMTDTYYPWHWTLATIEKVLSKFYKSWSREMFFKLLEQFGLNHKTKISHLSRGMKLKLMIATALSHDAKLLILDEPTAGLDAVARDEFLDLLLDFISDEKRSVLFSTHITADLEKIADYITFIKNGSIIYSGEKDALLEKYVLAKGSVGDLPAENKTNIIGYKEHRNYFDGIISKSNISIFSESVQFEKPSLDELMVRFYKEGGEVYV